MLDVQRKWTLYSFVVSSRERPANVNRKLLCLFHFLEVLLEVLSQYIHNGSITTLWPWAFCHHEFLRTGLVYVHGERPSLSGAFRMPNHPINDKLKKWQVKHTKYARRVWDVVERMILVEVGKVLQKLMLRNFHLEIFTNTPPIGTFHNDLFHQPSLGVKNISAGKPMNWDANLTILEHSWFVDIVVVSANPNHWCGVLGWEFVKPFSTVVGFRHCLPGIFGIQVDVWSNVRICHFLKQNVRLPRNNQEEWTKRVYLRKYLRQAINMVLMPQDTIVFQCINSA